MALGSRLVRRPGRRCAFGSKGVACNIAVCKVYFLRVSGFFAAIAWFCAVGKFQLAGDFFVKEADIEKGCAFDNRLVADIIADECIAAVFQAVFAGRLQDGIGFRS